MPDIIEQLEAGKKIQEEQGIDAESLRTKVCSTEEDTEEKPKTKRGRKKKEQPKEEQDNTQENTPEDPFEQAEQIMGQKKKEEKPINESKSEKFPGFNFHDYYQKGQKVFFVRVHEELGIKEFLELTLRTIYPKTIIGSKEKGCCYCIGPESKDMIFTERKNAVKCYDSINIKAYKDVNIKEELGNIEINDTED